MTDKKEPMRNYQIHSASSIHLVLRKLSSWLLGQKIVKVYKEF